MARELIPRVRHRASGLAAVAALLSAIAIAPDSRAQEGQGNALLIVRGNCSIGSSIGVFVGAHVDPGTMVTMIRDTDEGPGSYLGAPLCLLNGPHAVTMSAPIVSRNFAHFELTLPADSALIGSNLYFQAVVPDP